LIEEEAGIMIIIREERNAEPRGNLEEAIGVAPRMYD